MTTRPHPGAAALRESTQVEGQKLEERVKVPLFSHLWGARSLLILGGSRG